MMLVIVLFASVSCLAVSRAESPSSPREYQVKAAFLYTFFKFVEWPAAGGGASRPLCVAILGQNSFGEDLEALRGKTARGRTIVVRHYRKAEEVRDCDVVFISSSEKGHLPRILKQLQNSPVLTVADQEGFCQAGGIINLVTVRSKVSFEINTAAAQRAQLHISSQLLKLARIVVE